MMDHLTVLYSYIMNCVPCFPRTFLEVGLVHGSSFEIVSEVVSFQVAFSPPEPAFV
jgi:hypothetical protein